MPPNAEIESNTVSKDLVISVSWPLKTDPDRPNKRSKTIAIRISGEATSDFNALPDAMKQGALNRLNSVIASNLKSFDPEHNKPYNSPVPVEDWLITSAQLIG